MDTKPALQNIQDAFLNTARRERSTVTIYLLHGAKLSGRIKSFDKFSVLLESGSQELLLFKHAISTISHARRPSGELPRPSGELHRPGADAPRPPQPSDEAHATGATPAPTAAAETTDQPGS